MIDWRSSLAQLQEASAHARAARAAADLRTRLDRAVQLIDTGYDQPLDLDRLAREACLSPYHFHRMFRRELGETPKQYLTRRRIERAREYLCRTEMSVVEVCLAVGFHSLGSFTTLFRRYAGHAPGRYRSLVVQSLGVPRPTPLLSPVPSCFLRMFGTTASFEKPDATPSR